MRSAGWFRLGLTGRLWLAAALMALAITAITVVELLAAAAAQNTDEQESKNRAVVRATTSVLDDLQDAETGQRGYLLSDGDLTYLRPYEAARARLPSDLTATVAATSLPESAALVQELLPIVHDKMAELEETVELQRARRHPAALAIVRSGTGRDLMEHARRLIATINFAEARLRDQREVALGKLQRWTVMLVAIGGTVLALFTLLITWTTVSRLRDTIVWLRQRLADVRAQRRTTADALGGFDELEPIAAEFNELVQALHAESERRSLTEDELRARNDELAARTAAEQRRADTLDLVRKLSYRLSGCVTEEEFNAVIERMLPSAVAGAPGALYVFNHSRRFLTRVTQWAEPAGSPDAFAPHDCWALRRGRAHYVRDATLDIVCPHVRGKVGAYSCTPLSAQGETIGLLHLQARLDGTARDEDELTVLSEMLAITLANVRLRESLQSASIRDPLTGLFNRRYLQEAWDLESARSAREGRPIALLMLDIDHFKQFNDTFGHDAGDKVLRLVASALEQGTRAGDVVCRFGGEEFVILMIDANDENALMRAEALRLAVKSIVLPVGPQRVGTVTISVGIATFPLAGQSFEDVQKAADVALYQAKNNGRDRVEIASIEHPPESMVGS
jgi:diguanylate cyclase (GGDEF)-like protein